jgi:CPA2 family monovalent cation:H+ antiporter-2
MAHPDILATLTAGLASALLLGYCTQRVGLSPIVGYLLAGLFVGPHTPGFVADTHSAEQMAELGVILLMFGVGLHFHLDELLAVRRVAVPGAIVQGLGATLLGMGVGLAWGWSFSSAVVYGLALSIASTVVLTRVLTDAHDLHTAVGKVAIGWLVVQDLLAVLMLVLMPALFGPNSVGVADLPGVIGWALLKMAALAVLVLVGGGRVIPWLLRQVALTRTRELFTLTILVVALGIAVGSAKLFGVSMALGAFLAGMVVGQSDFSTRAATEALPMRDAFAVLFFVSVGMLFDPAALLEIPSLIVATLAIVWVGTPLCTAAMVLLCGYPLRTAIGLGLALTQIGEFSFIIAALGKQLNLLGDDATNALVATAIVSISVNPLLYRLTDALERWGVRYWPRRATLPTTEADPIDPQHRAVIVGYGPVGQTLVRLLTANEITATIIEMNVKTVDQLKEQGVPVIYGDAHHRDTLVQAGLAHAGTLFLSASGIRGTNDVIRLAREINPDVRILVRTAYLHERTALRVAGADQVFAGEGEVALAMTEAVLTDLGATAEQIDRERERLRADLRAGTQ